MYYNSCRSDSTGIYDNGSRQKLIMMKRLSTSVLVWLFFNCCSSCYGRRQPPTGLDLCEDSFRYTFDEYIFDFDRNYEFGTEEYNFRRNIFEGNIRMVIEHNRQYVMQRKHHHQHVQQTNSEKTNLVEVGGAGTSTVSGETNTLNGMAQRQALFEQSLLSKQKQQDDVVVVELSSSPLTYLLGINDFLDRLPEELPRGYDSMQSTRVRLSSSSSTMLLSSTKMNNTDLLFTSDETATSRRRLLQQKVRSEQLLLDALGGRYVDVSELPKTVDWRLHGVTTPVKNQGGCGSCWAFASTAVLESHIALQTKVLFELSEQELVSCTPNPLHCGGSGGCAGSTAELAYDFVRQNGMVQEWQFGYEEYHGKPVNCSLAKRSPSSSAFVRRRRMMNTKDDENKEYYKGAVAVIKDYAVVPSNNYTALMNVVAKLGPVTVSVACMPWQFYQHGVFHAPLVPGAATDIDHLVVLEGYGTDQETGEDYWLVRNSWGPLWGEGGYIRLKRVGDDECSMDTTPDDGTACTLDENGNPIVPAPQRICGNSGILFDSVIPIGGSLI